MNKNAKTTLLVLASALLLAGCNNGTISASSNSNSEGGASSTSSVSPVDSGSSSSSEQEATKYAIVDRTGEGVTITLSASKAAKGETVTITVQLEANYVLNGLYANNVACTKVNDATYTFVMGDTAVAITASLSISGDVVTSGDIALSLTKQSDGTYKGTFTAESEKAFIVVAGDKEYGYGAVDFNRSYAYIGDVYVSGSKATTRINVGGNATYEITFDLTKEKPIAIYRTGILHALESTSDVHSYFCGSFSGRNVLDGGAYNVKNLNHVEYSSTKSHVDYTWDLYSDGSFATAKDKLTNKVSNVYKSVKDGIYTVVDQYVETFKDSDGVYVDRTKTQDTVAYSGKYKIVSEVENSHYETTSEKAAADIATPSHEMHSINSEIQYGYYVGYTVESELKACDRVYSAKKNSDNSFTTTISSWKNYEDSEAVRTRYAYDITIDINADGTLKSVSYLETYYTKENWNFSDSDANGGTAVSGKEGEIKNMSSVSYGYGAAKSEAISFDITPYFISSIDKVTVKSNDDTSLDEGHIVYKEVIDECRRDPYTPTLKDDSASGYITALKIEYSPSTALDLWEYGVVASDDTSIVGNSSTNPRQWIGCGAGTTEVTIGNHSSNDVTKKVSVTIENAPLPTSYYVWAYGDETDTDVPSSSKVSIKAGRIMKVYLWASPNDCVATPIVSCSSSNIKVSVSEKTVKPTGSAYAISTYPAYILTIDASKVSTETALAETITVKDERDANFSTKISLEVRPGSASLLPSSIEGTTWVSHNYNSDDGVTSTDPRYMEYSTYVDAKLSFSSENGKEIGGTMYKKGTLTVTTSSGDETYNFYYNYGVGDSGGLSLKVASTDSMSFTIGCSLLEDYGLIGVYAYTSSWSGGEDTTETDIIGCPEDDDVAVEYEWFALSA